MTRATCTVILLAFTCLGIISVESQSFQMVPRDTCVPCGGLVEFNCSTIAPTNLGGGRIVNGAGGQMWRIQTPDGTLLTLSSSMPNMVPPGYEFVSPFIHVFTGLRVLNTNSTWNGTTLQCIAFTPADTREQNDSAAAVTMEVGSPPRSFSCECQCPDMNHCTLMWEISPTVHCSSLQFFNVALIQPDGTLFYSNSFGPTITSTQTIPLDPNTVYTATITAENVCGNTTCLASCPPEPAAFNVTARVNYQNSSQEQIIITWTTPGPDDPHVDTYTVNVSSSDGQQFCGSKTTGGMSTTVVLNVTGCVTCQGSNKNYAITVEASNRGGQTISTTSLSTSHIQGYQVRDISAGGQCALNVTCTVHDRAVATGCEFIYDSNGDGTLDVEVLINVPTMGNIARRQVVIDCNLNQINFVMRAVVGTTLSSTRRPLDCPVSDPSFNPVSSRVCPVLQNPQNGHVDYSSQQQTVGTTANYSCNSSSLFMLSGDEERECQIDAIWSGSAPVCTNQIGPIVGRIVGGIVGGIGGPLILIIIIFFIVVTVVYQRYKKERRGRLDEEEKRRLLEEQVSSTEHTDWDEKTLQDAASQGDLQRVIFLVGRGNIDVNYKDDDEMTALHLAAKRGRKDIVTFLVESKASVNVTNKIGDTPMLMAAKKGHMEVVECLCAKEADINITNKWQRAPLHEAAENGHTSIVECLLGKVPAGNNIKDVRGQTPLHLAATNGHMDTVKYLVEKGGAAITIEDRDKRIPLHLAADKGNMNILDYLIQYIDGADIDITDMLKDNSLPMAAREGYVELVMFLVYKGANINRKDKSEWTPLHNAARQGHRDIVEYLVGQKADLSVKDGDGWTPLHVAAERGHLHIVQCLIDKRANISIKDKADSTPLHLAVEGGHTRVVAYLCNKGASTDIKDDTGMTPLDIAVEGGNTEIQELLSVLCAFPLMELLWIIVATATVAGALAGALLFYCISKHRSHQHF